MHRSLDKDHGAGSLSTYPEYQKNCFFVGKLFDVSMDADGNIIREQPSVECTRVLIRA